MSCVCRVGLVAALAIAVSGCGPEGPRVAGGGGEITNGICTIDGEPSAGVTVMAFPRSYLPYAEGVEPLFVVTDSLGQFRFKLDDGVYNFYATDAVSGRAAFVPETDNDSSLGTVELRTTGAIEGTVTRNRPGPLPIDVYIPGSPFHTTLSQPGDFLLSNIPVGNYTVHVRTFDADSCTPGLMCTGPQVLHRVDVEVAEGTPVRADTVDVSPSR